MLDLLEELLWRHSRFPTILVDAPGSVADRRLADQADRNKFEPRGSAYLERVRGHYRDWAHRRGVRIVDPAAGDVVEDVLARLEGIGALHG